MPFCPKPLHSWYQQVDLLFILQRASTIEKSEGFYYVHKQPIPVESLSIHDIGAAEAGAAGMKNLFVIVQRSSFQQVIGVFTLQAHTLLGKVSVISLVHFYSNTTE